MQRVPNNNNWTNVQYINSLDSIMYHRNNYLETVYAIRGLGGTTGGLGGTTGSALDSRSEGRGFDSH